MKILEIRLLKKQLLNYRDDWLQIGMEKFNMYPFMIHSLALSIFSSVIGPFGGFFASGFKRAFKIKVNILSIFIALVGLRKVGGIEVCQKD